MAKTKPANEHTHYAEALRLARRKKFAHALVSWQDVDAVLNGYTYSENHANHVVDFFRSLNHTKGRWAGQPFAPLEWQERDVLRPLFGWLDHDGRRRYRRAYVEVPKKNGKSTLCSGLALYLLCGDGEAGAEVYSAAIDRAQATIVYREAAEMARASALSKYVKIFSSTKTITFDNSLYRVLSADAGRAEGLNIHGLIFDELHAQKNRELFDALVYGGASRTQPLLISITTAGYDKNTVCWEEHELAESVMDGRSPNPRYFAYIASASMDDDWRLPETWAAANPSFGVTISHDEMATACREAEASPSKQNAFRRYRLNQWVEQETRWLDLAQWDQCLTEYDDDFLARYPCWVGLDLASIEDVAAMVAVFDIEGTLYLRSRYWVPRENARKRELRHNVPYTVWAREGWLTMTDSERIDYDVVKADIVEFCKRFDVNDVAIDRWNTTQLQNQLMQDGIPIVLFGQGFASMAAPTKQLDVLIANGQLAHNGDPVLRWMVGNVTVEQDAAGNIKPSKSKSTEKIDGVVALVMAIGRWMVRQEALDASAFVG